MLTAKEHEPARLANPLFICSWERAVFLHYQVAPQFLQPQVPFELDLHEGCAFVSLVAFTLCKMRLNHPHLGFMTQPLYTHAFLNVRTYVRVGGVCGIYFLAEWLNNRLATMLGPVLYGLPYRFGKLSYLHQAPQLTGEVSAPGGTLHYFASLPTSPEYTRALPASLEYYLLERYVAFTQHGPFRRQFRVAHEPWSQVALEPQIKSATLLQTTGRWFSHAQFHSANFSPGLAHVQMGRPERLSGAPRLPNERRGENSSFEAEKRFPVG